MNSGLSVREIEEVFFRTLQNRRTASGDDGPGCAAYTCPRIFDNHAVIFCNDCVLMTLNLMVHTSRSVKAAARVEDESGRTTRGIAFFVMISAARLQCFHCAY